MVDCDVTDVVAGGELCETRDVPDDGEDDHGQCSPPPDLAAFDFPDGIDPAGQRQVTTPPTHALFLLNNPLVVEQARVLAEENLRTGDNKARVIAAYHRTLQRDPSPDEIERSLGHIRQLGQELAGGDAQLRAWASFTQSLLASNEFRYID